jgi:hypothetical protein
VSSDSVVALSQFHRATEVHHVLLPLVGSPDGTRQLQGVRALSGSRALMETRPGWKVLRVLGNLLGLSGFDFNSAEEVKAHALQGLDIAARLSNVPASSVAELSAASAPSLNNPGGSSGIQRIGEIPIHFADALVRRAAPLQMTRDALPPAARMCAALAEKLGLREGDLVRHPGRATLLSPSTAVSVGARTTAQPRRWATACSPHARARRAPKRCPLVTYRQHARLPGSLGAGQDHRPVGRASTRRWPSAR